MHILIDIGIEPEDESLAYYMLGDMVNVTSIYANRTVFGRVVKMTTEEG